MKFFTRKCSGAPRVPFSSLRALGFTRGKATDCRGPFGRDNVARLSVGVFAKVKLSVPLEGDGTVEAVRSVVNLDKLGHLGPLSDLARVS
jgi:hypothetical protein